MTTRIVRWNPLREMVAMQQVLDRAFDEAWRSAETQQARALALDVHETDTAYTVLASVPGLTADDISITLHDGTLTISGEFTAPQTDENTHVRLSERHYGKFSRSLNLPHTIDIEAVEAEYDNGVLALTLPKLPEAQPRQIPVRVGRTLQAN